MKRERKKGLSEFFPFQVYGQCRTLLVVTTVTTAEKTSKHKDS